MKRKILLTVIAVITLGSSMTAYAQPKTMPDGTVFDAEYYANTYPDVKRTIIVLQTGFSPLENIRRQINTNMICVPMEL